MMCPVRLSGGMRRGSGLGPMGRSSETRSQGNCERHTTPRKIGTNTYTPSMIEGQVTAGVRQE